jgi:hypothetical protein
MHVLVTSQVPVRCSQGWTAAYQSSAITCFVLTLHHQDVGPLADQVNQGALKLLDSEALPILVTLAKQYVVAIWSVVQARHSSLVVGST